MSNAKIRRAVIRAKRAIDHGSIDPVSGSTIEQSEEYILNFQSVSPEQCDQAIIEIARYRSGKQFNY